MHALDAPTMMTPLQTFFNAVCALQPTGLTYTIEGSGDIFESTTGEVSGVWTATAPPPSGSSSTDTYAAGVGAIVHWKTGLYLSGRLLRGRSFIVPCNRSVFDTDGTLTSTAATTLRNAAAALVTAAASNFSIWQRPREAKPADGSRPAITARGGGNGLVITSTVPDRGAWLSSRRS